MYDVGLPLAADGGAAGSFLKKMAIPQKEPGREMSVMRPMRAWEVI